MTDRVVWESYVEGPRWAAFGDALEKALIDFRAHGYDLRLDHIRVSKGFIRETTFFTVSGGTGTEVADFQRSLLQAVAAYG